MNDLSNFANFCVARQVKTTTNGDTIWNIFLHVGYLFGYE